MTKLAARLVAMVGAMMILMRRFGTDDAPPALGTAPAIPTARPQSIPTLKMPTARGWALTLQQCMDIFVGNTVTDKRSDIEARTGLPLTQDWLMGFRDRRNAALVADIEHALAAQ